MDDAFIQACIDDKTKPLGSLGILESIAFQVAKVQKTIKPVLKNPSILVFAGDHGIATQGVSAFPQEVTRQMVLNFLNGGAAINVFTKQHNIELKIIDAGVIGDLSEYSDFPNFYIEKIASGTKNYSSEPAMSVEECKKAISKGKELAETKVSTSCNIIGFGEMGIGNTSSASLIMSALCNIPIQDCVGRGTGVSDDSLQHKKDILNKAQEFHFSRMESKTDPWEVLSRFGGFELAMIVGAMLYSYDVGRIILVDGFISSACFLVAKAINPGIQDNAIFCHKSNEKGHQLILDSLNARPILQLDMRLGEGTGCAVAYPIIESAVRFLNDMASFSQAGVSNS